MSALSRTVLAAGAGAIVLLALAGCMDRDPYRRTDVWRPTGSNAANIAAQVADPHDLIRGRGDVPRANAEPSARAVDRINTDRPKPLRSFGPSSGDSGSSGGGTSSGSGGGSGAGGSPGS